MKEIVESYFQRRSMVNHQLASYNDCILGGEARSSRMEKIVRNIRIGTDEPLDMIPGGDTGGGAIKLGVSKNKVLVTVDQYANTSTASIPLTLDYALSNNIIKRGEIIVFESR